MKNVCFVPSNLELFLILLDDIFNNIVISGCLYFLLTSLNKKRGGAPLKTILLQ